MVTIKIGEDRLMCPSAWCEVSIGMMRRMREWDGEDIRDLLARCLDKPLLRHVKITEELADMVNAFDWVKGGLELDDLEMPDTIRMDGNAWEVEEIRNIAELTFEKRLYLNKYLSDNHTKPMVDLLPFCVAVYGYEALTGCEWELAKVNAFAERLDDELPFIWAWPIGDLLVKQNTRLTRVWNDRLKGEPLTSNMISAGVDKLHERFGVWSVIYDLAGGLLDVPKVYKMRYSDVFVALSYEHDKSRAFKRLRELEDGDARARARARR